MPKYYFSQYFIKSPNTSLAKFYKYWKAQVLSLAIFYQKPKQYFGKILQKPKYYWKLKYYSWQYFTKFQYYFGNILSMTQNHYFFDK